jgi:hypothetical protein
MIFVLSEFGVAFLAKKNLLVSGKLSLLMYKTYQSSCEKLHVCHEQVLWIPVRLLWL